MILETKMQIEALKTLEKDEHKPAFDEDEKFVYFTTNGYCAYRILKDHFFLNRDFLNHTTNLASMFSPMMLDKAFELAVTNEMWVLQKGKIVRTLRCKTFDSYINYDYLKMISMKGCKMYAKNEKSAILFVNDGEIYAVCMPVNLKKAD